MQTLNCSDWAQNQEACYFLFTLIKYLVHVTQVRAFLLLVSHNKSSTFSFHVKVPVTSGASLETLSQPGTFNQAIIKGWLETILCGFVLSPLPWGPHSLKCTLQYLFIKQICFVRGTFGSCLKEEFWDCFHEGYNLFQLKYSKKYLILAYTLLRAVIFFP